jgi:hypothetical protein
MFVNPSGGLDFPASVRIASILANGIVRIAAIAAGTYIVWLGHNTLIRGIKGEFEFSGKVGKLKASTPGLLFVLLGSSVIGWALLAEHRGTLEANSQPDAPSSQPSSKDSDIKGTSVPPPLPPPPKTSP